MKTHQILSNQIFQNGTEIQIYGIYSSFSASFPKTRVELDSGASFKQVWLNLNAKSINSKVRELLFLLIHNKIPTKERLFRIQLANDPYCDFCFNTIGPVTCNIDHIFSSCERVSAVWKEIRVKLVIIVPREVSDNDLIRLKFPKSTYNNEIIWLMGSYIYMIWDFILRQGVTVIDRGKLFGYLKYKFKSDQLGARVQFKTIPGLFD